MARRPHPLSEDEKADKEPAEFPCEPRYPHQYWFIDIRYLVRFDRKQVYSICIIEGVSRTILAGMASRYQDELAIPQLLHAASGDQILLAKSDGGNSGSAEGQYRLYRQANYLAMAKEGDVWFMGAQGPCHFDGETMTMYSLDLDVYNELAWVFGTPIVVDVDGDLRLAGSCQGIQRFSPPAE